MVDSLKTRNAELDEGTVMIPIAQDIWKLTEKNE
jgi:hypothetical protein